MKGAIKAVLGAFGLAPAAQVDRLTRETRDTAAKMKQLEERIAQARLDAETWKRRQEEALDAAAGWKRAAAAAQMDTDRIRSEVERLKAEVGHVTADFNRERSKTEEWKARADKLAA